MVQIEKEVFRDNNLTVLRITGQLTVDKILDELTRFYEEEFTDNLIWDFSDADVKTLSNNDLKNIAIHAKSFAHLRNNGKTAFVISSPLAFGLGRMYDSLSQTVGHTVAHNVFRSYNEAIAWINDLKAD